MKNESKSAKKLVLKKDTIAKLAVKTDVKTGMMQRTGYTCECVNTVACSGWTC